MHDPKNPDFYLRPAFSKSDRVRRLLWAIACLALFRLTPVPLHGWRCLLLRAFGANLGKSNFIYPTAKIWAPWLLETQDVVTIGPGVEIYNPGGVFLGDHTIVSQEAYLCGATHDYNSPEFTYMKKPIVTGRYTWICARAIVLPGVRCEEGSVLGAGSVTSRGLDAWTVYAGNPAKAVRKRERVAPEA